jgi:hypothetical protein
VFERSGVDLAKAKAGVFRPGPKRPWRHRLGLPGWLSRSTPAAAAGGEKP